MAAEDVGFGDRGLPAVIEALHAQRSRIPRGGERWLLAVHAVRLLVAAPKDRTSAELSDWAQLVVDSGRRGAEVIDVAVDMHTERGVGMGRGHAHFYSEGNVVENEVPERDLTWLQALRVAYGAGGVTSRSNFERP